MAFRALASGRVGKTPDSGSGGRRFEPYLANYWGVGKWFKPAVFGAAIRGFESHRPIQFYSVNIFALRNEICKNDFRCSAGQ